MLKAIELEPELAAAYFDLGEMYAYLGKDELAEAKLNDSLSRDPNNVKAFMLLGMLHQKAGNMEEAQIVYEKALEIDPEFVVAANNLAYIHSEYTGDLEKGFKIASKAHDANPDDPNVADTLGWILYKQEDYRWAKSLLEKSASKLDDNPEAFYHLGMVQLKTGDKEAAKQSLTKALELGTDFKGADDARNALESIR